jgi:peptidoglycan hydrolase-like protein with peptidoglycan-binding domain
MRKAVRWTATTKVITALLIVSVASAALGFAAGQWIRSPQQVAADAAPPPPSEITASVEVGAIQRDFIVTGEVTLGNSVELTPAVVDGGSGVVTGAPLSAGDVVRPGTVLLEVADRPAILLSGAVPLLRDLKVGDTGADVVRFQQALTAAGQAVADREGYFGYSTHLALRAIYKAAGYDPPLQEGSYYATALRSELIFAPDAASGRVVSTEAKLGQPIKAPAITITTTPLKVLLRLQPSESAQMSVGATAEVTGDKLEAPIPASVASIGQSTKAEDGTFYIPVDVAVSAELPTDSLGAKANVRVAPDTESTDGLLVPLAALQSKPGGVTTVTIVEGDDRSLIEVDVVETGDGKARVESKNDALSAGDSVLVGTK